MPVGLDIDRLRAVKCHPENGRVVPAAAGSRDGECVFGQARVISDCNAWSGEGADWGCRKLPRGGGCGCQGKDQGGAHEAIVAGAAGSANMGINTLYYNHFCGMYGVCNPYRMRKYKKDSWARLRRGTPCVAWVSPTLRGLAGQVV